MRGQLGLRRLLVVVLLLLVYIVDGRLGLGRIGIQARYMYSGRWVRRVKRELGKVSGRL